MPANLRVEILDPAGGSAVLPDEQNSFWVNAKVTNSGSTALRCEVHYGCDGDVAPVDGFPVKFPIGDMPTWDDPGQQFSSTFCGRTGVITVAVVGVDDETGNTVSASDSVVLKNPPINVTAERIARAIAEVVNGSTVGGVSGVEIRGIEIVPR